MEILNFCSSDLSAFYLDISKDALYCDAKNSLRRQQIQTVLYRVAEALLRILNPILPFTMDEFNRNLPGERVKNVQLLDYPTYKDEDDEELFSEYDLIISLRKDVLKALEEARNEKIIGSAQEAHIYLDIKNPKVLEISKKFNLDQLATLFVVSEVTFEKRDSLKEYDVSRVEVLHHEGQRCDRCWNYSKLALVQEDGSYLCPRCQKVINK